MKNDKGENGKRIKIYLKLINSFYIQINFCIFIIKLNIKMYFFIYLLFLKTKCNIIILLNMIRYNIFLILCKK